MKFTPEYIHQLMTEKLAGVISAIDEHYLDELIESVPAVREKWQEVQSLIPTSTDLTAGQAREWPDPDELLRRRPIPAGKPPRKIIPLYRKIAAAAASIAAALVLGWGLYTWLGSSPETTDELVFQAPVSRHIELKLADGNSINLSRETGSIAANEVQLKNDRKTLAILAPSGKENASSNTLTVPAGLDYKIDLSDGTEVWLNSTTEIKFPFVFTGSSREVSIRGEAYLKVARDTDRPFIVHLPESTVRVLGTEFNVNTYEPGTERIALIEGSVGLTARADRIRIEPGYQGVYRAGSGWSRETFDKEEVLGWRKGLFYFHDASLEDICRVLPRWFGTAVVIDDPSIRSMRFAGIVDRNQSLEVFLDNLKAITDIDYYFEPGKRVLHFRKPSQSP